MTPLHLRLIAPALVRYPAGTFANQPAPLTLPRGVGEVLTVGANLTREQASELLAHGDAVDAYGTPPRWEI